MTTLTAQLRSDHASSECHRASAGSSDSSEASESDETLAVIEELLGESAGRTAETGCGRSTILFSNRSREHHVFCVDDRGDEGSSVQTFLRSPLTKSEVLHLHFGPTQQTLAGFDDPGDYDLVLIDGPHGFPFPELEYFHFYPRIREGGFLVVADVRIPTIGRMADFIQEDVMWDFVDVVGRAAVFRRTDAKGFPTDGDNWWTQNFNRRRARRDRFRLDDGGTSPSFSTQLAGRRERRRLFISLRSQIERALRSWRDPS